MRVTVTRWRSALATAGLLAFGQPVSAHGGEDHRATPVRPEAVQPADVTRTASTAHFELVLRLPPLQPGREAHAHLYVSDYATNQPIAKARIAIEWGEGLTGVAMPSSEAGIYDTTLTLPRRGELSPLVTIQAGDASDLITLDPIPLASPAPESRRRPVPVLAGVSLLALAGTALLVWWIRRNGSRPATEEPS